MPTRTLALERGGPKALRLRWRRGLKDFEASLGADTWRVTPEALRVGAELAVPGGAPLRVRHVPRRWWSVAMRDDLLVERDGLALPGSDGDPATIARRAASLLALFGVARVLLGGLWLLFDRGGAAGGPRPMVSFAAVGVALLALAVAAGFGRRLPLALGAALLAVELLGAQAVRFQVTLGTLLQVLVIVHLADGWRRARPAPPAERLAKVFE